MGHPSNNKPLSSPSASSSSSVLGFNSPFLVTLVVVPLVLISIFVFAFGPETSSWSALTRRNGFFGSNPLTSFTQAEAPTSFYNTSINGSYSDDLLKKEAVRIYEYPLCQTTISFFNVSKGN